MAPGQRHGTWRRTDSCGHTGQERTEAYAAGAANARFDQTRFASCPGPLDAKQAVLHGLALRPAAAGRYTVYATNHGGCESVEVFELSVASGAAPSATWIGCAPLPPKLAANSVAAFSDGTLVATVLFLPGRTFEDAFALRNTGIILQWTPGAKTFVELKGTEFVANNGIETSPDDREFSVASTSTQRVYAFSRAKPGAGPLWFAQLKDFGPDNVRWTPDNRLITAGLIDEEPACGGKPKNEAGIRCPMGYAVATIDPRTRANDRDRAQTANARVHRDRDGRCRQQRALARLVLRQPVGVSRTKRTKVVGRRQTQSYAQLRRSGVGESRAEGLATAARR